MGIRILSRKLLYEVGVNDSDYVTYTKKNGKGSLCPFYRKWAAMLERCYCKKSLERNPTYSGCSVVSEWYSFMAFREWMMSQDWKGKQIDKDLKIQGNKIYGPDTCIFVPPDINKLLTNSRGARGLYKQGVSYIPREKSFVANVKIDGVRKKLGRFKSEEDAYQAYIFEKNKNIEAKAALYPYLSKYLLKHRLS